MRLLVKQAAADWLREYADENWPFHCTEVGALYPMVSDTYAKGLPSGAGSQDREVPN